MSDQPDISKLSPEERVAYEKYGKVGLRKGAGTGLLAGKGRGKKFDSADFFMNDAAKKAVSRVGVPGEVPIETPAPEAPAAEAPQE